LTDLVHLLNQLVGGVIGLLVRPFGAMPMVGFTLISLLSGVLLLMFFGWFSPQARIREVKRRIGAAILEVALFRHDQRLALRAQGRMLGLGSLYLSYAVPPLLILMLPCVLILGQLSIHYAVRPVHPNEAAILHLRLDQSLPVSDVALSAPPEVEISPPVRAPKSGDMYFRLKAASPGKFPLTIQTKGSGEVARHLFVGPTTEPLYPSFSRKWYTELLSPSDLKGSRVPPGINEMALEYPETDTQFFGYSMNWLLAFFLLSLASGLVASRWLKVAV